jgi:hypothetical protein
MKILIAIHLILSFTIFGATDNSSALVVKSKGKVSVTQPGKEQAAATAGALLINGTRLQTGEDGLALVKLLEDNSIIRVAAQSILTIRPKDEKGESTKKAKVSVGSVLFEVQKKLNSSIFQVETPTSVATVKGTKFWIVVKNDSVAITSTLDGEVEVEHSFTREKRTVLAGKSVRISGKKMNLGATNKEDIPADTAEKGLKIKLKDGAGETRELDIDFQETP